MNYYPNLHTTIKSSRENNCSYKIKNKKSMDGFKDYESQQN